MLNIVNVGYDSTNYYLIETAARKLLVDIGFPGTLPKLLHVLKRKGIALASINYLLCTHYHPDHAGLAEELKRQGVQLIVLESQLGAIPELRRYMKPEYRYVEIRTSDAVTISAERSRAFLLGLGIEGEIVATPGHSDDSVTLILDGGMAFTGDLPPPFLEGDEALKRSWARLRAMHVSMAYPGHGPVYPWPPAGLGEASVD